MNLLELFVKIGVDDQASSKISQITETVGNGLKTAATVGTAAVTAAATGVTALTTAAVNNFSKYEQLAGGAQKIFDQMGYSKIANDANNAYKDLGLSANQYLAVINDVGATFAATMGDEAGYEAAKTGLKAISDYASGTGKNVNELSQKFTLITRSTSSYQSIADQFSGILPATSAGFLEQAQAAGILSDKYKQLTEVPIDEYQAAVSQMLEQGVADLGLANNTMNEAFSTLSGSLSMAMGAWNNLVTGLADDSADLDMLIGNFVESVGAVATNLIPKIGTALNGASKLVRELIPVIVQEIPVLIEENLPLLVEAAISIVQSLVDGISENQEMLITTAMETITYLVTSLISMLPQIVAIGLEFLVSLANGIAQSLPELIPTIVNVVLTIVQTILDNLPLFIEAALQIIVALTIGIINAIPELVSRIPEIITAIVVALVGAIPQLATAALQIAQSLGQMLYDALPEPAQKAVDSFVQGFQTVLQKAQPILDGIKDGFVAAWNAIKSVWEAVQPFFSTLFETIKTVALPIIDAIKTTFIAAWEAIKVVWDVVVGFFQFIWDAISGIFSVVENVLKGDFEAAWNAIKGIWDSAVGFFSTLWDGIKEIFSIVEEWFGDIFEDAVEAVKAAWDGITQWFSDLWDDITGVFSGAWEWFKGIGSNIVDGIKNGISSAWEGLSSWVGGLWDGLTGLFGGGKDKNDITTAASDQISKSINSSASAEGSMTAIGGVVVNQNIYSNAQTAADLMEEAMYQQRRAAYSY